MLKKRYQAPLIFEVENRLTASEIRYALSVKIKLEVRMHPAMPKAPGKPTYSTMDFTPNPEIALVMLVSPLMGENHFALCSGFNVEAMKDQYCEVSN